MIILVSISCFKFVYHFFIYFDLGTRLVPCECLCVARNAILYALLVLWLHPLSKILKSTAAALPPVIELASHALPKDCAV